MDMPKLSSNGESETPLCSENASELDELFDSKTFIELSVDSTLCIDSSVDRSQVCSTSVSRIADTDTRKECLNVDLDPNMDDLNLKMATDIRFPEILNERWGSDKRTLLHIVAQDGQLEILHLLLEAGADPALWWV